MSPEYRALLRRHLPDPSIFGNGEAALMPTLVRWLISTGRVRARTSVASEVPWLGRRVDLALLNGRGLTTAFELKIGRLQRVMEQAAYNRESFHRSWVVTGNRPREEGLDWARELGVGLLVVQQDAISALVTPTVQRPHPAALKRLRATIQLRAVS
jgi:hypothetical protein